MVQWLSTYCEACGMAPVSAITTIFGSFCVAFVVVICWPKLVEDGLVGRPGVTKALLLAVGRAQGPIGVPVGGVFRDGVLEVGDRFGELVLLAQDDAHVVGGRCSPLAPADGLGEGF